MRDENVNVVKVEVNIVPARRSLAERLAHLLAIFLSALVCFLALAGKLGELPSAQSPSPAWRVESLALPTNFIPEDENHVYAYEVRAVDITGAPLASGVITLTDTLPAGLGVQSVALKLAASGGSTIEGGSLCETTTEAEVSTVTCKVPGKVSGQSVNREAMTLSVRVTVPGSLEGEELLNEARIEGAGATADTGTSKNLVSTEVAPSGLARFETELLKADGTPATQAGSHPYLFTTSFELNTEAGPAGPVIPARGDLRDVQVTLPPGLIGDPTSTGTCSPEQFNDLVKAEGEFTINACPASSVVGWIDALAESGIRLTVPVFNLTPPLGMPAQLGFQVIGLSFYIDTELGPAPDHPIIAKLTNLTEIQRPIAGRFVLWGTPAEESHDPQRTSYCLAIKGVSLGKCPAGIQARPFLRLPTSCASELTTEMLFDTWDNPLLKLPATSTLPAPGNCAQVPFSPTITAQPSNPRADSPSGMTVTLKNPQSDDPEQLASADLRKATVTLPEGVTVNPASGGGLEACSPAQIDLGSTSAPTCPAASKLATVKVTTPLLDHPAPGSLYLASQGDNPFGSLIALYLVIDDPQSGVVVKLAGKVDPDPATGRLTATFADNPQFPFSELEVSFFDGPRAALRMPRRCGPYTTTSSLEPWSAPESGPPATPTDSFAVSAGPGGGPCPSGALDAQLSAGVQTPIAGTYSPFTMRLSRPDGSDEFSAIDVAAPTGLTGALAGIPYCPEAAIAAASSRSAPGQGAAEAAAGSCPAASLVGSVKAGAGAGPYPLYVAGKVYLAGPYKGAPISFFTVLPALAGPFDLGTVTNRIAVYVDPETAQVSAKSDPLPTILSGIPVDARDIIVSLDRPKFTLAPTSCAEKAVHASVTGLNGSTQKLSDRFQVGACKALGFSPSLKVSLKGGTRRTAHPALHAVLKTKPGQANASRIEVILPPAQFIDQNHINNPCTRVQFAADQCPPGSVLGKARAFTPLLDKPLEGPIYFRSNGGERELPDIVADLGGQIDVLQVGFVDSVHRKGSEVGRIRTTFASVPDAPITKVVIDMKGGKKQGLLVNSRNLCRSPQRLTVRMRAHNGRTHNLDTLLGNGCGGKKR